MYLYIEKNLAKKNWLVCFEIWKIHIRMFIINVFILCILVKPRKTIFLFFFVVWTLENVSFPISQSKEPVFFSFNNETSFLKIRLLRFTSFEIASFITFCFFVSLYLVLLELTKWKNRKLIICLLSVFGNFPAISWLKTLIKYHNIMLGSRLRYRDYLFDSFLNISNTFMTGSGF